MVHQLGTTSLVQTAGQAFAEGSGAGAALLGRAGRGGGLPGRLCLFVNFFEIPSEITQMNEMGYNGKTGFFDTHASPFPAEIDR